MSFHLDWNDTFKATVVGALGLIPEVGGLISKIVASLWPDSQKDVFPLDQIYDYINSMMSTIIDQQRVHELRSDINGLKENLHVYATATSQSERQSAIQFLLNECSLMRTQFFDESISPHVTLTYLVAFGTIRLGLLREKYLFYETIYGQADSNRAKTLKDLTDEIAAFKARADQARAEAITWRKGCITITGPRTESVGLGISKYTWTVADTFAKYSRDWVRQEHINGPPSPDDQQAAQADYSTRQAQIDTEYAAGLDNFLDPARFWPGFDPTSAFTPTPRAVYNYNTLADGKNPGGNRDFDDRIFCAQHGALSKLIIYHGDWVDGIEAFYGGVSSGLRGARNGSPTTIDLGPGEAINVNGGTVGDYMTRWWVSTNLRPTQQLGGGGRSGTKDNFWIGYPYPNQPVQPGNYRIAYLAGKNAGNRVDQVRVAWLHYEN